MPHEGQVLGYDVWFYFRYEEQVTTTLAFTRITFNIIIKISDLTHGWNYV